MNVFINAPADNRHVALLRVMTFVLTRYGCSPRIALEDTRTDRNRLQKILELIAASDLSIHDLSRIKSSQRSEYARMNMPFELGIDYGRNQALGIDKPIIVLEEEKYSFHKGLSDLSGFDILCHRGEPIALVKVLRDWFVNNKVTGDTTAAAAIWYQYTNFETYIYRILTDRGYSDEERSEVPYTEFKGLVAAWVVEREVGER